MPKTKDIHEGFFWIRDAYGTRYYYDSPFGRRGPFASMKAARRYPGSKRETDDLHREALADTLAAFLTGRAHIVFSASNHALLVLA